MNTAFIGCVLNNVWLPADKEDPLRITDNTRSLGLVVRFPLGSFLSHCIMHHWPIISELYLTGSLVAPVDCQNACSQVCRGTAVMMVSPVAGTEELTENPFHTQEQPEAE